MMMNPLLFAMRLVLRRRRQQQQQQQRRSHYDDLLRSIVLLCVVLSIMMMTSVVTVQITLPQFQAMLDGTFTMSTTRSSDHPLSIRMFRTTTTTTNDTNPFNNSRSCLKHKPFHANNTRVSITNDTLLEQPTATICGTLRRRHYWEHNVLDTTSTEIIRRHSLTRDVSSLSPLAQQMEQHQSNCSLPVATFHMDNDFGLGSHLYLWSQALCNAWQEGYRVQTYNPEWLWLDQSYCKHNTKDDDDDDAKPQQQLHQQQQQSPLLCYFPLAEHRCSSDAQQQPKDSYKNVTDPRNERLRCQRLQNKHKNSSSSAAAAEKDKLLSQFRAASMEYLFHQAVSLLVLREAERQVGLLFGNNNNNNNNNKNSNSSAIVAPDNLITVHMRWGDKFWEMDLVPAAEYVKAIFELLEQRQATTTTTTMTMTATTTAAAAKTVNIYLACEDPKAVKEFLAAAPKEWNVYVDRTVQELSAFRPRKGNRASWTTRNTKGRAGLVALGSLLVGLEANDFVLTTKSNWSRLMNELRKNVLDPRCNNCTRMIDLRPGNW